MSTDPKLAVRAFYEALGRGDAPALQALFANTIAWTEAERFPYFGGTWTSFGEVIGNLLVPLSREWDGFSATSRHLIAEGDEVAAFGAYGGVHKATGKRLSAPFVHHWTVADGKITSFTQYTDTAKVIEATEA